MMRKGSSDTGVAGAPRVVRVPVEPLTDEAFAPFGELLAARERPADFHGVGTEGWIAGFETDGRTQIMVLRTRYQGLAFSRLERHLNVTQTFAPLSGAPCALAVAPPTGARAEPAPDEVRAFLLDGTAGYVLKRGTWHSLDRYPLHRPGADWVIVTDHETTDELVRTGNRGGELTQMVDFAERGVSFELAL